MPGLICTVSSTRGASCFGLQSTYEICSLKVGDVIAPSTKQPAILDGCLKTIASQPLVSIAKRENSLYIIIAHFLSRGPLFISCRCVFPLAYSRRLNSSLIDKGILLPSRRRQHRRARSTFIVECHRAVKLQPSAVKKRAAARCKNGSNEHRAASSNADNAAPCARTSHSHPQSYPEVGK